MEALRRHLQVDRWLVLGGSWGSTLALAYAEQHPERVSEMILLGVTTGRHAEFDWLFRGWRVWPRAELAVVDDAGHAADAAISEQLVRVTERFANDSDAAPSLRG